LATLELGRIADVYSDALIHRVCRGCVHPPRRAFCRQYPSL